MSYSIIRERRTVAVKATVNWSTPDLVVSYLNDTTYTITIIESTGSQKSLLLT